jgi:hypothetical protein
MQGEDMRRIISAGAAVLFAALGALPAMAGNDPLEAPSLYLFEDAAGMDFFGGAPDPQQAKAQPAGKKLPLFDFRNAQMNIAAGLALFGGDFEAGADFAGSVSLRVPMPALPTERIGAFVEILGGHISRDLESYYTDTEGFFFGGALGVDFSFIQHKDWMLLGQLGGAYVAFDSVTGLDNSMALMLGLEAGTRVSGYRGNNIWMTVAPQFFFDGEDWFLLATVGIAFGF